MAKEASLVFKTLQLICLRFQSCYGSFSCMSSRLTEKIGKFFGLRNEIVNQFLVRDFPSPTGMTTLREYTGLIF